jgi:hypothetical protein
MQKIYEAPELNLIGEATQVVLGSSGPTQEFFTQAGSDFEFEQDEI